MWGCEQEGDLREEMVMAGLSGMEGQYDSEGDEEALREEYYEWGCECGTVSGVESCTRVGL